MASVFSKTWFESVNKAGLSKFFPLDDASKDPHERPQSKTNKINTFFISSPQTDDT
jgi:hypothetical protein